MEFKRAVARPLFFHDLLTQAELCNDCTIAVDVLLGEVVEKASALADHHQKAAAGMVVLLVLTQVLGQLVDSGGQDSDLDLGRTASICSSLYQLLAIPTSGSPWKTAEPCQKSQRLYAGCRFHAKIVDRQLGIDALEISAT